MYSASFIILYYDQQMHNLSHKISHSYMYRHYRVILWELVINALLSYKSILNAAVWLYNLHLPTATFNIIV